MRQQPHSQERVKGASALSRQLRLFTVISVILVLFLSALPNIYPDHAVVHVASVHTHSDTVNIKAELTEAGFTLAKAHYDAGEQRFDIRLTDPARSAEAARILREHGHEQVKVVSLSSTPQWLQSLGLAPMKLGLDLGGGVLFVLQVDTDQALATRLKSIAEEANTLRVKARLRGIKIHAPQNNEVRLVAAPANQAHLQQLVDKLQASYPKLDIGSAHQGSLEIVSLRYLDAQQQQFAQADMTQALATLRSRIEELGITEAVVQRQGERAIRIELPGVQDPSEAKRIIGATAQLSFHGLQEIGGKRVRTEQGHSIAIESKAIFTGADITGAQAGRDEMGQPMVQLQLSSAGGDKINRFSRAHIGQPMATLYSEYVADAQGEVRMREQVISVATINEALGTRFSITGLGTWQRAQDLALVLRAGSLEAPITIVKEQTMTPSLGKQNIENGFNALLLGLALTLSFMLLWYRRLGVVANLALAINLIALVGLMSLLPGVVLTLPGIAGLVLTIGMAVDTNVIIFERIKEELRLGRTRLQALKRGYQGAMSSIIDANLTTFISALVLIGVGYGPVKGFAITLALGILTSVFSGVLVSSYLSHWLFAAAKEVRHG